MSNIKPQTGFVGFFDILGYVQIMLNNNIYKTSEFVSDTLVNIPNDLLAQLKNAPHGALGEGGSDERENWQSILDQIKWIIFSDSILISLPFDPQISQGEQLQNYLAFSTVCSLLMNRSFNAGFPLRGAISVGEFFIQDRCFAGRPIIHAYHLAQDLEFAGCVLDDEANNYISNLRKDLVHGGEHRLLRQLDRTTILYIVPTKQESESRHRVINWVTPNSPGFEPIRENVREKTARAFLMHNKIAVKGVERKMNNTEMFIRHVLVNLYNEENA